MKQFETKHKQNRKELAYWMRRLYQQGLTTCSGGNVSLRDGDFVYITASQTDKALIKAKQICVLNLNGENFTPNLKPSMETGLHLEIYKSNLEIKAIIHAHPCNLSVLACADIELKNDFTGEQRYLLGEIGEAPYFLMGSQQLAMATANACKNYNAVIMKNHGAICTGQTLFQAFDRMEVFEALAYQFIAFNPNLSAIKLTKEQIKEIDEF
ncbi:MAG: class II aldolase/adducin family protein [Bacteroidales bacterium]|nr:class II aldolase/adducin family protein [Bacteroidales bacterium]